METKEIMDLLHSLKIGACPKTMIALVLLGKKPCTELDIYTHNTPPSEVKRVLETIGLVVILMSIDGSQNVKHTAKFCVALDKVYADMLVALVRMREKLTGIPSGHPYHKLYGVLMGYPLSAIDGFISNNMLSENDPSYPETAKNNLLLVFKLSAKNWADEMNTLAVWEHALLRNAPQILDHLYSTVAH
ncbi:MAG TPA: hypothetical protein PLQ20_01115 [Candidatus Paceibacterota bacterium]|nr:hypothetical protein [Candidatus Paceibacterota bacterium]